MGVIGLIHWPGSPSIEEVAQSIISFGANSNLSKVLFNFTGLYFETTKPQSSDKIEDMYYNSIRDINSKMAVKGYQLEQLIRAWYDMGDMNLMKKQICTPKSISGNSESEIIFQHYRMELNLSQTTIIFQPLKTA